MESLITKSIKNTNFNGKNIVNVKNPDQTKSDKELLSDAHEHDKLFNEFIDLESVSLCN